MKTPNETTCMYDLGLHLFLQVDQLNKSKFHFYVSNLY